MAGVDLKFDKKLCDEVMLSSSRVDPTTRGDMSVICRRDGDKSGGSRVASILLNKIDDLFSNRKIDDLFSNRKIDANNIKYHGRIDEKSSKFSGKIFDKNWKFHGKIDEKYPSTKRYLENINYKHFQRGMIKIDEIDDERLSTGDGSDASLVIRNRSFDECLPMVSEMEEEEEDGTADAKTIERLRTGENKSVNRVKLKLVKSNAFDFGESFGSSFSSESSDGLEKERSGSFEDETVM